MKKNLFLGLLSLVSYQSFSQNQVKEKTTQVYMQIWGREKPFTDVPVRVSINREWKKMRIDSHTTNDSFFSPLLSGGPLIRKRWIVGSPQLGIWDHDLIVGGTFHTISEEIAWAASGSVYKKLFEKDIFVRAKVDYYLQFFNNVSFGVYGQKFKGISEVGGCVWFTAPLAQEGTYFKIGFGNGFVKNKGRSEFGIWHDGRYYSREFSRFLFETILVF